jgi:predicted ferric reductase
LASLAAGAGLHHALTTGRFSALGPVPAFWWAVGAALVAVIATLYGWRWWHAARAPWRLASVDEAAPTGCGNWTSSRRPAPPPLPYHAGQFVWMTEGPRRFPLFDHPFSIADSPHARA